MASNQFLTSVRAFASAASNTGRVKPPIQVFGLEGRYATALFSAASKLKQLDQIEKDLASIKNSMQTDKIFREFILNPTIKRSVKTEAVLQVAKKINLTSSTTNLLGLLAENGRMGKFDGISAAFTTIMGAQRGDIHCNVTTAKPLDEQTKADLQTALKAFAKKGENIILEMKVEPSIIGGMIVSIGDRYVDMSIATKIKKYTNLIQEAV